MYVNLEAVIQIVYEGVFKNAKSFNKKVRVFLLGIGTAEEQLMKNLCKALKKAEINNAYFKSQGTALEWLTWRRFFHEFAPMLFNNRTKNNKEFAII